MKKVFYLLFLLASVFQANAQRGFGIHGGYSMPTSNIKPDAGAFLFLKDVKNVGFDYSIGFKNKASGFKFSTDYIMGSTDQTALATYVKGVDFKYSTTNFTAQKPKAISVMAGPNIALFIKAKKLPMMWLDLQAGAIISQPQSLQFLDAKSNPTKEIKNTTTSLVYSPTLTVNLFKTKGLIFNAKVGYSSIGGLTFGLNIAERDCRGWCCDSKCGACCFCGCSKK